MSLRRILKFYLFLAVTIRTEERFRPEEPLPMRMDVRVQVRLAAERVVADGARLRIVVEADELLRFIGLILAPGWLLGMARPRVALAVRPGTLTGVPTLALVCALAHRLLELLLDPFQALHFQPPLLVAPPLLLLALEL